VRRYCIKNKLDRLWTLTYAEAVWSYEQVKADLAVFFKALRAVRGGRFPYLWVIERHPNGHGLHVHIAMRGFIRKGALQETWGHGIVHFSDRRRKASEAFSGAELAAYFAKELAGYLVKEAAEVNGTHFYDVAQGFQPEPSSESVHGPEHMIWGHIAGKYFGGEVPVRVFRSSDLGDEWEGPPVQVLYWYGRRSP
jgi:hypothetical protein